MDCQKIEIVGVAGTGKSTLARTLADRDPGNRIADSLHTKIIAHWAYVAHSAPRVLPLVARSARVRPAFDWEETKFIVYVTEWRRFLRRACRDDSGLVVLDQGPIFALARLLWGGKPVTSTREFEHWLDENVAGWSVDLDVPPDLVPFDAAGEPTLFGRIITTTGEEAREGRRQDVTLARVFEQAHESARSGTRDDHADLAAPIDVDDPATWWQGDAARGIGVPIGRSSGRDVAMLWLDSQLRSGAVVVGEGATAGVG